MPDFLAGPVWDITVSFRDPSTVTGAFDHVPPEPKLLVDDPSVTGENTLGSGSVVVRNSDQKQPIVSTDFANGFASNSYTYEDWFEHFHVIPRELALGNILSTILTPFEVYSAFRRTFENWSLFVNGAGAGTTMNGLPTLPYTFGPQSSGDLTLQLEVSTTGVPVVDDTLDFGFNTVPETASVSITLRRVVLFSIQPELPFTERLQWLTEVMSHINGTEQRLSVRKNPRQLFSWDFFMEDGPERSFFHNVMFDWQASIFGLPIWFELTRLSIAASATDTVLTVESTDFADYRVGGLVVIFTDRDTFDVQELSSLTATTLTLASGILSAYPVGTFVMPLRTGVARRQISGSRFLSGDAKMQVEFRVDDNDVDLADTSAFNSFNSKVLIDGCNSVRGQMSEQFERDIIVFDNSTGLTAQGTPWDVGKRTSQLALLAKGKEGLWEVRQLLHALRGKQTSFYASSFTKDLTIDSDIAAGSTINVANVGYTQFVRNRQPRDVIRIVYNDGSADDLRTILSSTVVDPTREALVVDSALGAHVEAVVEKIMFVEKVRWDTDEIAIRHEVGDRTTRITGPIKTVLE